MKKVIIDTDPGIDDVLAILFALGCPEISVEGLTTVSGNVPVAIGTKNALKVLEIADRTDIPVACGAAKPLKRELITAEWVHGKDGLANMNLPAPEKEPVQESAIEWMRQKLLKSTEPITVIALGPLTNLGMLYCLDPDAFSRIKEIVFMGGAAFCSGNTTAAAEFNIYVDPDAAKLVVESGVPITMVGLDVTMKTILKPAEVENIIDDSKIVNFAKELVSKAFSTFPVRVEMGGLALHDPLAIGVAIEPGIITTERMNLSIETDGNVGIGATIVDNRPWSKAEPNANIAIDVDSFRFKEWFLTTLNR
jgi:purine nucleosidase